MSQLAMTWLSRYEKMDEMPAAPCTVKTAEGMTARKVLRGFHIVNP